jgi:hypothetical protein
VDHRRLGRVAHVLNSRIRDIDKADESCDLPNGRIAPGTRSMT